MLQPATVRELSAMLEERTYSTGDTLVTGTSSTGSPNAGSALAVSPHEVLSTGSLSGVSAYKPADMTVTVGAGMRIAELQSLLAEHDQWLPVSVCAAGRSTGGLVAAAPPGRYDWSYGPVRRHVLGCRMVAPSGSPQRWGRAVMKNVAGYDMRALMCGSRGRLGVLTEVTFRVWARPARTLGVVLNAGTEPGESLHTLCTSAVPETDWRPDSVVWSVSGTGPARLTVRLEGSDTSVDARAARLHRWTAENSWTADEAATGNGGAGADHGSAAAEVQRSLEVRAYRATVAREYLPSVVQRLRAAFGDRVERLEAFPLGGIVRARVRVEIEQSDESKEYGAFGTFTRAVDVEGHRAAVAVERGSASDLTAADERRDASTKRIESRVVQALGGGPRHWRGDYL